MSDQTTTTMPQSSQGGRVTRNSAKAAEKAVATEMVKTTLTAQEHNHLDKAFAEKPGASFVEMAGMREILDMGNFLNEAVMNLSLEEKMSLVFTELVKLRRVSTQNEANLRNIQQQLQTQEEALRQNAESATNFTKEVSNDLKKTDEEVVQFHTITQDIYERLEDVEAKKDTSERDKALFKGFVEKHEKQLDHLEAKLVAQTNRSMQKNLTIPGIMESRNENCIMKMLEFLRTELNIPVEQEEIKVAHRMGNFSREHTRLMVIKVTRSLKERIPQNKAKLKGRTNERGEGFFINIQQPEAIAVEKKVLNYEVNRIKKFNELQRNKEDKLKFVVKNKQLFVENELHVQHIFPPRPTELFASKTEQKLIDKIKMVISTPRTEDGSVFVGLAAQVKTLDEVNRAYRKVRQMYPSYDHAMMAYWIQDYTGYQDDGEHSASIKLHALLLQERLKNVALFVVRNFGGTNLGGRRFQYITEVAQKALDSLLQNKVENNNSSANQEGRQRFFQGRGGSTRRSSRKSSRGSRSKSGSSSGSSRRSSSCSSSQSGGPQLRSDLSPDRVFPAFEAAPPEYVHNENWELGDENAMITSQEMDPTVMSEKQSDTISKHF